PGVSEKDIDVNVENGVLTITGEKKHEEEVKKKSYFRVERCYGKFLRSFTLPSSVKTDSIEATFKDGILKLFVPKSEEAKPKSIPVKTG
ncbi:MAG: Hsp20/alpha crystallin family protein, partial [bacterium]